MPQLVALTGPAGSGKSFCANIFVEKGFQRIKFATPLKDMLGVLLMHAGVEDPDMIHRYLEGNLKEFPCHAFAGKTPRHAMQTLGTEWGRDCIDPDFWCNLAMYRAKRFIEQGIDVVIDDCRFISEASAVIAAGGDVVRVFGRSPTTAFKHVSEKGIPVSMTSETLNNTGNIDTATKEVERILRVGKTL